jgi:hypothetical protein
MISRMLYKHRGSRHYYSIRSMQSQARKGHQAALCMQSSCLEACTSLARNIRKRGRCSAQLAGRTCSAGCFEHNGTSTEAELQPQRYTVMYTHQQQQEQYRVQGAFTSIAPALSGHHATAFLSSYYLHFLAPFNLISPKYKQPREILKLCA